jgi:prepilin-type N-terminal cleavage/methylation domain-containing protein
MLRTLVCLAVSATRMTKRNRSKGAAGFSLIELMAVVTIGATLMGLAAGVFRVPEAKQQKIAMHALGHASRYLFNIAKYQERTFRIVVNMDKNLWHVEYDEVYEEEDGQFIEAVKFSDSFIEEEYSLPDGLEFDGVATVGQGEISVGTKALHVLAGGFVEPSIVYFKIDEPRQEYSLVMQPLTGFADLQEGRKELRLEID